MRRKYAFLAPLDERPVGLCYRLLSVVRPCVSASLCVNFSSAAFRGNPRYCYSLGVIAVVFIIMQKLTFCNISVTTEDIYLKLGICVQYTKINPYYQERQFKTHFFRNMPIFRLTKT